MTVDSAIVDSVTADSVTADSVTVDSVTVSVRFIQEQEHFHEMATPSFIIYRSIYYISLYCYLPSQSTKLRDYVRVGIYQIQISQIHTFT